MANNRYVGWRNFSTLAVGFVVGAITFVTGLSLDCPANGLIFIPTSGEQRCYWFDSTQRSWDDSNSQCANNGGTLAIIDNADQDSFVLNNIIRPDVPYPIEDYIYFGLHDKYTDNDFLNARGESQSFFRWAPANPSPNTECGSINSKWTDWHDVPCYGLRMSVCSKDPSEDTDSNLAYFTLEDTGNKHVDGNPLFLTASSSITCASFCILNKGLSYNYIAETNECIVNIAAVTTQTALSNNKFYVKN